MDDRHIIFDPGRQVATTPAQYGAIWEHNSTTVLPAGHLDGTGLDR